MDNLSNDWCEFFLSNKNRKLFKSLNKSLADIREKNIVYPPSVDIFNAFKYTSIADIRVVIIGQDPYHGEGEANGLAFSVNCNIKIPPSLLNIYKNIEKFLGIPIAHHGSLRHWARQGVFLLNRCLTVTKDMPASHKGIGWETFTENCIHKLNDRDVPIVYILLGNEAKKLSSIIDISRHYILASSHPSPLGAYRGFNKVDIFGETNNILKSLGQREINWSSYMGVVFDLDGTLLYTIPSLKNALNFSVGKEIDYEFNDDETRTFIGSGIDNLIIRALEYKKAYSSVNFEKIRIKFFEEFNAYPDLGVVEYEGITEMLIRLKERGFLLGVYTNKAHDAAVRLVDKYFANIFDFVIGEKENIELKPSVFALKNELKARAIDLQEVIYVGDSDIDMQTGINGNMRTIGVSWGYREKKVLKAFKPYRIVDKPNEILRELGVE